MTRIVLDTGPLGKICHPKQNQEITQWLTTLLANNVAVYIPEICDYELRRELIRAGFELSIQRLNQLEQTLTYLPITTETMHKAAELWAEARHLNLQTADDKALDGDMILSAQALQVEALIATENVGHLSRFAPANHW